MSVSILGPVSRPYQIYSVHLLRTSTVDVLTTSSTVSYSTIHSYSYAPAPVGRPARVCSWVHVQAGRSAPTDGHACRTQGVRSGGLTLSSGRPNRPNQSRQSAAGSSAGARRVGARALARVHWHASGRTAHSIAEMLSAEDDDMPGLEDMAAAPTELRVEATSQARQQQQQRLARMSLDAAEFSDEDDGELMDERIPCLFGPTVYRSAVEAYQALAQEHGFDVEALRVLWSMDFYDCIKLINYVRRFASELVGGCADVTAAGELRLLASSGAVVALLTRASPEWQDDSLMVPVLADDGLLTGLDDEDDDDDDEGAPAALSTEDISAKLLMTPELFEQLNSMQSVGGGVGGSGTEATADVDSENEDEDGLIKMAKRIEAEDDSKYFDSYSFIEIHETMLKDKARTEAYRDAMMANKALFEGATVIDVGCGTGILSIFAVQAGAARVVGIDASNMAKHARQIVKDNGYADKITIIQGKVEDLTDEVVMAATGGRKADILVSEWMGYFLVYESMLSSVLVARDRWGKQGVEVMPQRAHLYLSPITNPVLWKEKVGYWDDVYGVNMQSLRNFAVKSSFGGDCAVNIINPDCEMDAAVPVYSIDCNTVTEAELQEFEKDFAFKAMFPGEVHGFCAYFDVVFGPVRCCSPLLVCECVCVCWIAKN